MSEYSSDTEKFKQDVIRLEGRVMALERDICQIKEMAGLLHKMDIELERVETKVKTTWYLLMLIVGGMISIAFSLWGVTP